jgi:hypothetical protein
MEFYLNQKSIPMIRKCANCRHFYAEYESCSLKRVTSAYDHKKNIFLRVGENLFCEEHIFRNEATLRDEAIIAEYSGIEEAMEIVNKARLIKDYKKSTFE